MAKRTRGNSGGKGKAAVAIDPEVVAEIAALLKVADAAGLVAVVGDPEADKPRRALARKALHRLREQGVEIPEADSARSVGARVRMAAAQAEGIPDSRVTAPDGTGTSVVWLVRPGGRGGGLRVAQAVVSEKEGVEEIVIYRPTRSEWRRVGSDIREEEEVIVGDVPAWEAASWLRPFLQGDPTSRAARQRITELREMVAALPAPADRPHPVYGALGEDPSEGDADGGSDMLDIRPLNTWIPDVPPMEALLAELEEADDSPLELTDVQKEERTDGIVNKHVDAWADAATQARLRVRIEQTARVLTARGELVPARRLLAGLRAMARADAPSDTPWVRAIMANWLAPAGPASEEAE